MYIVYIDEINKNFKIEIKEINDDFKKCDFIYCEYHLSKNIAKSRKEFFEKLSYKEIKKLIK